MKIVLVLSVVFLDYVLTMFQTDAINNAETSGIKRLTEQVGSYVYEEGGCLVQDEMLIPNNPVIVHKRDARDKKHKNQKHIRHQINQNKKKAKLIQRHVRNAVNERKKATIKSVKARINQLYMMINKISSMGKISRDDNKKIKPTEVKNMTITTTQKTLKLVNTTVENLDNSLKEYGNNVKGLIIMCISELKNFSLESNSEVKEAVDSGDKTGAREILNDNKKTFEKITKTITKNMEKYYASAEKTLKDLADCGGDLVKKTAETQVKQMEGVKLKTGGQRRYLSSASKNIKSFSKYTADMFQKMITKTVQQNDEMIKKFEETLNNIPNCQLPNCKLEDTAIKKEEVENRAAFDKLIQDVLDRYKLLEKFQSEILHGISSIKGNALITSLENTNID